MIEQILELIDEEIGFEREELKDIRESKGDQSSYGAGYSAGVIEAMQKVKRLIYEGDKPNE